MYMRVCDSPSLWCRCVTPSAMRIAEPRGYRAGPEARQPVLSQRPMSPV